MRRHALSLLGMAALIAASGVQATAPTRQDAVTHNYNLPRPVSQRNIIGSGDANPRKHLRKGFLNQEEKRKKLRGNHHFARSRKCTTKR